MSKPTTDWSDYTESRLSAEEMKAAAVVIVAMISAVGTLDDTNPQEFTVEAIVKHFRDARENFNYNTSGLIAAIIKESTNANRKASK